MSAPEPAASELSSSEGSNDNRRAERHDLTGTDIKLLCDGMQFIVHLKDLSCTGICGLTDAPLAPGQMVCLMMDKWEPVTAQIRWIRRALIGASFPEPLTPEMVARLKRSHANKRKK